MRVKTEIPKTPDGLRVYCAIQRISQTRIAQAYGEGGCCQQWVSLILNEQRPASADVIERIREAIQKVEGDRCQRRKAS